MKKFQQGGVSVYNVPQGIVQPTIPNSPVIHAPLIPVVDMAPYLNAQMDQDRRKEAYDRELVRQQQAQVANDQKNYYAIHDKVFGELHNPAQKAIIDQVKADYKIDDDAVAASDNGVIIKSQIAALQRAARDSRTLGVLGEVEAANKLLQRPMPQLAAEEVTQYQQRIDDYFSYGDTKRKFNVKELDANYWNRPSERAIPTANFTKAFTDSLNLFQNGIDPNSRADLETFGQAWASRLEAQNKDQALAQGYITYPEGSNIPVPTEKGQELFMNEINLRQRALQAGRDQKLEDQQATRLFNNAHPAPRTSTEDSGSTSGTVASDDDVNKAWNSILSIPDFDKAFGIMNPFDPKQSALYAYIRDNTKKGGTFMGMDDLAGTQRELARILRQEYTPKYNPAPAVTPGGLPVAPPVSNQTATKPAGTWEFGPDGKRRQVQ